MYPGGLTGLGATSLDLPRSSRLRPKFGHPDNTAASSMLAPPAPHAVVAVPARHSPRVAQRSGLVTGRSLKHERTRSSPLQIRSCLSMPPSPQTRSWSLSPLGLSGPRARDFSLSVDNLGPSSQRTVTTGETSHTSICRERGSRNQPAPSRPCRSRRHSPPSRFHCSRTAVCVRR